MGINRRIPRRRNLLSRGASPWEMYFDGAARRNGTGARVMFVSTRKDLISYSFVLTHNCSNNESENQAILLGFGMAVKMKLPQLNIYGDSALVIKQLIGEFKQYILAATDYFSKWAEAAAYREVKATTIADFIRTQIIYRYGVPQYIVTNNGTPFRNKVMDCFCEKFRIQQRTSSAYNPTANGLVEAFNKTLCKILKKTIGANKKSWDEKLGEALWAYRTSFRTPTQSTPYLLVYGTEAVLPLEVQLPSLCIAIREGLITEECAQLRLAEHESLDEQRLEA
ncbi:hypothetical protein H6P81_010491 [Aristolochia fimbriata]|uniref:Integrase catalytic domain-containing protein n=1 Tax=Aristolochia fimbriata TaxID=158543 RepID=A0AAV7ESA8_ARIFI|nr:hypothetical protein H6P81_010491 [Aristolochia fimbriata]